MKKLLNYIFWPALAGLVFAAALLVAPNLLRKLPVLGSYLSAPVPAPVVTNASPMTSFSAAIKKAAPAVVSINSINVVERTIPDWYRRYFGTLDPEQQRSLGSGIDISARAAIRYVGRSYLGVSPPLDLRQGRYAIGDAQLRVGRQAYGVRLSIDNLFNVRANRFSYGNPFSVADGRQITPLRPRTVRIGFDAAF